MELRNRGCTLANQFTLGQNNTLPQSEDHFAVFDCKPRTRDIVSLRAFCGVRPKRTGFQMCRLFLRAQLAQLAGCAHLSDWGLLVLGNNIKQSSLLLTGLVRNKDSFPPTRDSCFFGSSQNSATDSSNHPIAPSTLGLWLLGGLFGLWLAGSLEPNASWRQSDHSHPTTGRTHVRPVGRTCRNRPTAPCRDSK